MASSESFFDWIELVPRLSCTLPTITWFKYPENRIPENFKENEEWKIDFLDVPKCPKTLKTIRLIKSAPFNFELRNWEMI